MLIPVTVITLSLCVQLPQDSDVVTAAEGVVLSVCEEPGLAILIEELFKMGRKEQPSLRVAALGLVRALCERSDAPLLDHTPQLIVYTTESLSDGEEEVCVRSWGALKALVTKVSIVLYAVCYYVVTMTAITIQVIGHKQLPQYIGYLNSGLKQAMHNSPGDELHGFTIKVKA